MLFLRSVGSGLVAAAVLTSVTGCCQLPSGNDKSSSTDNSLNAKSTATTGAAATSQKAAAGGDTVSPSELEFVEMKVSVDKAEGDPKKDAFNFFRVWGEVRNKSSKWVESIRGDIRYYDASGKELGIDSIGTAVKQDLGDKSPGEPVRSEVMFIPPGGSVPLEHIRSLNKIGGSYASYKITLRPARVVTQYPEVVLDGKQDGVANVANEDLPNSSPHEHRVISGTLRNKGTLGCHNPGLIIGYYDASGKLADLKQGDPKDVKDLAPGASAPVKVFTLVGFDDAWKAKATIKTWTRCEMPY